MPKLLHRPSLHINLLKPQGEQEPVTIRLTRFLLSTGRYIIIFVEIIVLGAFVSRFKLDSDLQNNKEAIDQQIPVIKSLRADEALIRQTQLQLATIKDIRQSSFNYVNILQKIAAQTPTGVKLTTINMQKDSAGVVLKITGQAQNNSDLTSFTSGLRNDTSFSNVSLSNASLDQGAINFSLDAQVINAGKKL